MKQPPKAPAAARQDVQAPEPPRTVGLAVRLMYAGAGLTLLGMIVIVIEIATGAASIRAGHPSATVAQVHATQGVLITYAVISGLLEAAIWIVVARLNRAGMKWARIAATVLFALNAIYLVDSLLGPISLTSVLNIALRGLAGLGAVYYLWQKESASYFADRVSAGRPDAPGARPGNRR